ncbi:hypothetical protein K474DRAFT_1665492 [Panus rudis PR-1116 ss-1]|nr:hypothetical protein K474DRAFT_1665492 [Panus rudis PR-1116 ss-1]
MPFRNRLLYFFRTLWLLAVFWIEYGSFKYSLWGCSWPDEGFHVGASDIAHVLLISDPQVPFNLTSRPRWKDSLRGWLYRHVLQKNWMFASQSRPDVIVFLGDMLANGFMVQDDAQYTAYYEQFRDIFRFDKYTEVYYAPGNKDVGLHIDPGVARVAREHHVEHFGPVNGWVTIKKHTFAILDAPGIVEEDYLRSQEGIEYDNWPAKNHGAVEFIRAIAAGGGADHFPTILFTHIPLHRPESASCGPLRERGSIHRGVGPGYQNTLGKKTTEYILTAIRPGLVFSGDDRDYCEYVHQLYPADNPIKVKEVTVKSFSPVKYIRYPGFHLLSIADPLVVPPKSPTLADRPCLLPDYYGAYPSRYFPLFMITLIVVFYHQYRLHRKGHRLTLPSFSESSHHPHEIWPPVDGDIVDNIPSNISDAPHRTRIRISLRSQKSPAIRSPQLATFAEGETPTLRASLRSSPPLDGSFLPSASPGQSFYPPSPSLPRLHESLMSPGGDSPQIDNVPESPFNSLFSRSPPASAPESWWKWTWSNTFVFRGRRRRVTITLPAVWRLLPFSRPWYAVAQNRRKRGYLLVDVVTSLFYIFWPSLLLWGIFTWWTLL